MSTGNSEKKRASLGQRAFTVFCDVYAKDAVAKNNSIHRASNEALRGVDDAVHSLQVFKCKSAEKELLYGWDVRYYHSSNDDASSNKDADKLICTTRDDEPIEFPLEDLPYLQFHISGIAVNTGAWFGTSPYIWVSKESDTVGIRVDYSEEVSIEGKLENYGGTIDVVRRYIDTTRVAGPGAAAAEDDFLDGSTFKLEKLMIAQSLVNPILALAVSTPESDCTSEEDQDLKDLIKVMPSHKELRKAHADRLAVRAENARLKRAQDHYQSFQISSEAGIINAKLDFGRFGVLTKDHQPAWTLELPAMEQATIRLTAIPKIQIRIANIPVTSLLGPLYVGEPRILASETVMILPYSGGIEMVFAFDDSLNDVDRNTLQADLSQHVRATLLSVQGGDVVANIRIIVDGQPLRPLPELTMRLLWVSIRLEAVQKQLDLLSTRHGDEEVDED